MNVLNKAMVTLLASTILTTGANAAINNMDAYLGVKAGQMNTDFNDADFDVDNGLSYGLYGGYDFGQGFGVEAEYTTGESDLTVSGNVATINGTYTIDNYGVYGTYRYPFSNTGVYAKGKLGFANVSAEAGVNDVKEEEDKAAVAGGVGVGMNFNNVSVEAEYAMLPSIDDVDNQAITVGAHFKF